MKKSPPQFQWFMLVLLAAMALVTSGDELLAEDAPLSPDDELIVGLLWQVPHLNPMLGINISLYIVGPQLYASPLRFDSQGKALPYLAESWEIAPDHRSVTLHLREGAVFHDGEPITARDLAFSLLALREHHPSKALYAAIDRVETPDPLTAVIRFSRPHPAIEFMLSPVFCPILPAHIYGDGQPLAKHPANWVPVGSGPFRFVSWEGDRIILERNDDYFLPDRPRLRRLIMPVFGQVRNAPLMIQHQQLHLYGPLYRGMPGFEEAMTSPLVEAEEVNTRATGLVSSLIFNVRRKPTDDLRVRQAIAMGLDRHLASKSLSADMDPPLVQIFAPNNPFYTPQANPYPYDPQRANALLDEAGYPKDGRGVRFTLEIDYLPAGEIMQLGAETFRHELRRNLGIDLHINHPSGLSSWGARLVGGDFHINYWALYDFPEPLLTFDRIFRTRPADDNKLFSNPMGYSNPAVDHLLDAGAMEIDFARRKTLYAEAERLIMADVPYFSLQQPSMVNMHLKGLKGLNESSWNSSAPFDQLYWERSAH